MSMIGRPAAATVVVALAIATTVLCYAVNGPLRRRLPRSFAALSDDDGGTVLTRLPRAAALLEINTSFGYARSPIAVDAVVAPSSKDGELRDHLDESTLFMRPRCGVPDSPSRRRRDVDDSGGDDDMRSYFTVPWWQLTPAKRLLLWYFDGSVRGVGKTPFTSGRASEIRYDLTKAFEAWTAWTGDLLQISETQNATMADITISFHSGHHHDGYPFDGQGSILAHAYFPSSTVARLHMDDDEHWLSSHEIRAMRPKDRDATIAQGAETLFGVFVHEIGHNLGLLHTPNIASIMFPFIRERLFSWSFVLAEYDRRLIRELYATAAERDNATTSRAIVAVDDVTIVPRATTSRPPPTTTPRRRIVRWYCRRITDDLRAQIEVTNTTAVVVARENTACSESLQRHTVWWMAAAPVVVFLRGGGGVNATSANGRVLLMRGEFAWYLDEYSEIHTTHRIARQLTLTDYRGVRAAYELKRSSRDDDPRVLLVIESIYYIVNARTFQLEAGLRPRRITALGLPPSRVVTAATTIAETASTVAAVFIQTRTNDTSNDVLWWKIINEPWMQPYVALDYPRHELPNRWWPHSNAHGYRAFQLQILADRSLRELLYRWRS